MPEFFLLKKYVFRNNLVSLYKGLFLKAQLYFADYAPKIVDLYGIKLLEEWTNKILTS